MQLSKRKVSPTKASCRVKPAAAEGPHKQQRHRAIANARERDRTESVNYAFTLLRSLLPTEPPNRKLSKIEVLRLATSYIEHLDNVRTAVNTGDTADNVCVRMKSQAHPGSATKGRSKVCCTFCVTASKKKMTTTDFSQTPTQVEIVDIGPTYSELGWSCNFDLTNECLVSVAAVPGEMTKSPPLELQAEQTISYTELDNMSTLFVATESSTLTATPLLETAQSGGLISFSSETFDWNSSDLVNLNQWNYSLIE